MVRSRRVPMALLGLGAITLLGACRQPPPKPTNDSLVVLLPAMPESLDPLQDGPPATDVWAVNVFEPLLRSTQTGAPAPVLASSWEGAGTGELKLTLAPGVRFHDGTPMAAAEVVSSLEAARRATGSPFARRLADVAEIRAEGSAVVLRAV